MAKVLNPLNHDGRHYEPGEEIDVLSAEQHAALAQDGVVSAPEPEQSAKKTRAK